jgi:hypothetical protein
MARQLTPVQKYGAPALAFATAAALLLIAWLLWQSEDPGARGASLAIVGAAAIHLVKEVQEVVKFWLRE